MVPEMIHQSMILETRPSPNLLDRASPKPSGSPGRWRGPPTSPRRHDQVRNHGKRGLPGHVAGLRKGVGVVATKVVDDRQNNLAATDV